MAIFKAMQHFNHGFRVVLNDKYPRTVYKYKRTKREITNSMDCLTIASVKLHCRQFEGCDNFAVQKVRRAKRRRYGVQHNTPRSKAFYHLIYEITLLLITLLQISKNKKIGNIDFRSYNNGMDILKLFCLEMFYSCIDIERVIEVTRASQKQRLNF